MIKRLLLSALVLAASGTALAADTDPLDFDYQVVARAVDRPALIFNDGSATYIQPRSGQQVQAEGAQQNGPYWVVDGVPDVVRYTVSGQLVVARWKRANGFTSEPANSVGDLPSSLAAISGRIALIGSYTNLPLVRPGRSALPLAQMVRTIAPTGWSGTAQKDIALTDDVSIDTHGGENWLQVLGRVLEQRNLYAEVDFGRRNIALRGTPPKGFAVEGVARGSAPVAGRLEVAAPAQVKEDAAGPAIASVGSALPEGPSLASAFDAMAIRDAKNGKIEIRFDEQPKGLVVRDVGGKVLDLDWNDAERVLSFATVDQFSVTGGGKSVEVARVPGIAYLFPTENGAGLERIFEKDGATYLSFAKSMASISVFGESREGRGEQKDRFYRFNGISDHLTVIADGNVVQVDRVPEVRFYERAAAR
ncbi:hypothetical protein [Cupriavidus basilensis]|uniref:hypothetical protein n=1 Tax=Cupriavidus basilensis TaxID=68895 RepID=UPI000750C21A|nr:hypothetical protein [Cupriavidus basilensis]